MLGMVSFFVLAFALCVNAQWRWDTLANMSAEIKFPVYTPAERMLVVNQATLLFQVYVNRQSKIENYGPQTDPVPKLSLLREMAPVLNDAQFHEAMSRVFLSLRDFHTAYILPAPYACYLAAWPLKLALAYSEDLFNAPVVVVSALSSFSEVLKMSPEVSKVTVGDVLISYNNMTFIEMMEKYQERTGGANHFGSQRSVLNFINLRSGKQFIMPQETHVVYVFRRSDGTEYSVSATIASRVSLPCLATATRQDEKLRKFQGTAKERHAEFLKQLDNMVNPYIDELKEYFTETQEYLKNPTADPILSWSTYQSGTTLLGIIRLDSFVPTQLTADGVVRAIRDLLVNDLKHTDALVFDVRSNGGGQISLADGIPQLFTPLFSPMGARALVSHLNEIIFNSHLFMNSEWAQSYAVSVHDKYTRPVRFTARDAANTLGMAYLKPVAVLTNANCYSACDLFAASMQDSGAAVIFGEDPQTGAGGANVVEWRKYFVNNFPESFRNLPFGQDMRVGWRQTIRNGIHENALIEDIGIIADVVVRPSANDFVLAQTSTVQLDKIARFFRKHASKKMQVSFIAEPQVEGESEASKPVVFSGIVSRITKLELLQSDQIIGTMNFEHQNVDTQYALQSDTGIKTLGYQKFTILGYVHEKQVLQTHRYIRFIPFSGGYLVLNKGLAMQWDFNFGSYAVLYNKASPLSDGWNKVDNGLVIGNGVSYMDNTISEVSFFCSIPEEGDPMLHVKGDYDTEAGFDFFLVLVRVNGTLTTLLNQSGEGVLDEMIDLGEFKGNSKVEVALGFRSDGAVTMRGVRIESVKFTA